MTDYFSDGNVDEKTVAAFGDEWTRFDQSALAQEEKSRIFEVYFGIFPWHLLGPDARGFDMGCGSGRWAALVAPRVGHLTCIDPSSDALAVARRNLEQCGNVGFLKAGVSDSSMAPASQDFGYSLGVLHHIPDTPAALKRCADLLKPGAPFLVYLYYRFDHRPAWFRLVWRVSDAVRREICRLPPRPKRALTDLIAGLVYFPLARTAWYFERIGVDVGTLPLSFYKDKSFYTMRTDSRDRFGTPLEQRFTKDEIRSMMREAGLTQIRFSDAEPYWVACGIKA